MVLTCSHRQASSILEYLARLNGYQRIANLNSSVGVNFLTPTDSNGSQVVGRVHIAPGGGAPNKNMGLSGGGVYPPQRQGGLSRGGVYPP